jgi:hypothetical protein
MRATALHARIGLGRTGMSADANAMAVQPATRADIGDMGAGMDTAIAHASAGADDMARMPASGDTMLADARAGTDTADMGACTHAMLVNLGANPHAQDIDA